MCDKNLAAVGAGAGAGARGGALRDALAAAAPVMLGYLTIGLPCGVMAAQAGISWWQMLLVSATFYSGAGEFMMSSMALAGAPLASIILSVSLVSSRQMLYAAAFSPYFGGVKKPLAALFAATVTDESFGVNLGRMAAGGWDAGRATLVNLLSMASWAVACAVGCAAGALVAVPVAVMSFAMTSIFICLLVGQSWDATCACVVAVSVLGVCAAKLLGLGGVAVLVGAVAGVAAGMAKKAVSAR